MITGLEDDMYCAHTPIPVRVTGVSADTIRMQIYIDAEPMLTREPILCQDLNGDFLIDLSPWVKQFMPSFRDNMTYQPGMQYNPNPQAMEMRVEFYSQGGRDEATRTFVNCATSDWRLIDDEFVNVKVWQCYPFSFLQADFENIATTVVTGPLSVPGKSVEYNADCCRGIYVKWLNRYGYYSYWLFPDRYTRERSADEYYKVAQNIFDSNRDGSHRSAGFEAEDIITIRDKVSRKYIGMFADLVSSPEVQILNPDYVLGSVVTPADWIRIIQDNPEMEDDAMNSTFDFEMDFTLPKRYTQTLI